MLTKYIFRKLVNQLKHNQNLDSNIVSYIRQTTQFRHLLPLHLNPPPIPSSRQSRGYNSSTQEGPCEQNLEIIRCEPPTPFFLLYVAASSCISSFTHKICIGFLLFYVYTLVFRYLLLLIKNVKYFKGVIVKVSFLTELAGM